MEQDYILVVGAGLSGAVIAERCATVLGLKVLVVDKRDHIGGNCYDYIDQETGIRVSKYGAHIFHTNEERVWEYINNFSEWIPWKHKVIGKITDTNGLASIDAGKLGSTIDAGKLCSTNPFASIDADKLGSTIDAGKLGSTIDAGKIGSTIDAGKLGSTNPSGFASIDATASIRTGAVSPVPIPVNIDTVNILLNQNIQNEEQMKSFLDTITHKIDEPKNSEEVCLSKVGETLYNLIFKEYTKKQWDKYPHELDPSVLQRIPVRTDFNDNYFNDRYQALPRDGYTQFIQNMLDHPNITVRLNTDYLNSTFTPLHTFYTGPIDHYFSDIGLEKLEYRSIDFKYEYHELTHFQENSVVNYPSKNVPFTRIIEYKHFLNQKCDLNKTIICKEYSVSKGDPYYPVPNKRNAMLYQKYKNMTKDLENVTFLGRLADYKYYNMDQAILNALRCFDDAYTKIHTITQ